MASRSLLAGLFAGLLVGTPPAFGEAAPQKMNTVSYAVADLVVPVGTPGKGPVETTEARLIRVIESTVAPASWQGAGGPGAVEYFPLTMSLVVRQTPDVQEQVQDLLAALRRMLDVEVVVETRFLTLPAGTMERLGLDAVYTNKTPGVATLNDTKLHALLEAAQGDRRANVMQAPKMTLFNGQKGNFDLTEQQEIRVGVDFEPKPMTEKVKTGLEMSVLPTVSPDGERVTLQLGLQYCWAEPPAPGCCSSRPRFSTAKLDKTLKLADGTTAMFMGWTRHVEVCNEASVPVLSRVPYVNRLFKTVSYEYEPEHTFVLVTPRIVTNAAKEEAAPAEQEEPKAAAKPDTADAGVMYVNKKAFALSYELDNVGPSKVESIQVWVTRDGQKWEQYPNAVKPLGALPVTVKGDGKYGFTLVPRNGVGLCGPTPKEGDKPQIEVVVDTTKPTLELYNPDLRAGEVVFHWKAEDNLKLADQPVNLYWSEQPEGPWRRVEGKYPAGPTTLAAKLESVPYQFYLRATATDAAGNVAEAITPMPVRVDAKVPAVRNVKVTTMRGQPRP